ncbi:hypothetical protein [Corynebacterium suicordis]|uniref:Uncharacterized protein n=1 Tax=Corynebacterium suicordis DSM 45110 TaxID=1121369 RepID=A0ABR9ZLY1_9CORY|nr:hypothetical protein [Corynebacterium suicordis]MBF4554372.1 hypothetical protein [Corynebacterium suicordis DSM 45110]MDR6278604.1 hypothetical protein [Corynebacterium suicordis]
MTPILMAASAAGLLSGGFVFAAPAVAAEGTVVQPGTETPTTNTPPTTTGGVQPGTETPAPETPVETPQPGTETPAPEPEIVTPQPGTETPVETPVPENPPVVETPAETVPVTQTPVEEPTPVAPSPVTETPSAADVTPAEQSPVVAEPAAEPVAVVPAEPVVVEPPKPVILSEGNAEITGPDVSGTATYITVPFKTTVNASVETTAGTFEAAEVTVGTYDLDAGTIDYSIDGKDNTLTVAEPVAAAIRAADQAIPSETAELAREATAEGDYSTSAGQWSASSVWGAPTNA